MRHTRLGLPLLMLGCLAPALAFAQPAAREFFRKSTSTMFQPNVLVDTMGRRAAKPIVDFIERGGGGASSMIYSAVQQLPRTGHPMAIRTLERCLSEKSPVPAQLQASIRHTIIQELGKMDTPDARRLLARLLGDPLNKMYRREILKHCGRLQAAECGQAIVNHIRQDKAYNYMTVINLALCDGKKAVSVIREDLKARKRPVLYHYEITALGAAGQPAAALLVEQAMAYPVRRWSGKWAVNMAWALGRVQDARAPKVLRSLVKSDDPMVVFFALQSLAIHRDKGALGLVRRAGAIKLKRDNEYEDDGYDRDWGHHRRERIRQVEFDAAAAYARAALGDRSGERALKAGSAGKDAALAMLADAFLLRLGDHSAARRLVTRIDAAADKAFAAVTTDMPWKESLLDALFALRDASPDHVLPVAARLVGQGSWVFREPGESIMGAMPVSKRIQSLVASLGRGTFLARAAARDRLRVKGEAMLRALERAAGRFDLDGRALSVGLLAEFDDAAGKKLLGKLAKSDPAWQIRALAREALAERAGLAWPPKATMGKQVPEVVSYGEAEKVPENPMGACELGGKVYVAGKDGLTVYDGYQWRPLTATGMCADEATAVGAHKGKMFVFTRSGVAVGDGRRFACKPWAHPVVNLSFSDKQGLLLGTEKGLYRFDGKTARHVPGSPARPVAAMTRQGKTLWVAYRLPPLQMGVRQQPALAKQLAPPDMPPALYRVEGNRFQPVTEPLIGYAGWKLPMEVFALAAGPRGSLFVGCSEGLLAYNGRRWDIVDQRQGYHTRYGVDAIHVASDDGVTVLQGIWLDQRDRKGRWHRKALADTNLAASLLMASRRTSTLTRANGDVWLILGDTMQQAYKLMPGRVVRMAGTKAPERKLPPETLVVMARAGEWRWENPDTKVRPPNLARVFGKGKPVEVPAAQATMEAAAQDPWDYEGVEFQFKLDERPWGKWQKESAILTPLLGEGEHLLRVRARDASGNIDPTPAVLHFTVHTREVAVVRVLDGKFKEVFPAQHRRYEREGVGQVEVENRATEPLNLKLNLRLRDLFDTPATRTVRVPPGGKMKISLNAPFNDRVLALTGGAEVQAVVEVEFEYEGIHRQVRRSFPMKIHAANALDWSDPEKLAGFINSADPLVEKMGAAVYRAFTASRGARVLSMRNLALAAYLFRALDAFGVRYKPDPDSPFSAVKPGGAAVIDTVRFPGQTLSQKVGDCDDLVVLYASLLEQVGVRTAVIPVEGHVFLMFDTGVVTGNRASFQIPDDLLVKHAGSLWAPVEVTYLGREDATFDSAWAAGAEAYKSKYRPRPDALVDVRAVWAATPPAVLRAQAPVKLAANVVAAGREEVDSLLQGYRQAVLAKAPAGGDAAALLSKGRLLAKNGLFNEAERVLSQAARKEMNFDVAYALGVVHTGVRKTKAAVSDFKKAGKLAGDNQQRFRASIALATTLRAAGKLKAARKACDQALKFNPAARFDSKYSSMVRFLRSTTKTKASSETGPPPFFQTILAEM